MYKMKEKIVLKAFTVNLRLNVALFVLTNYAELSKKVVIASKSSAALELLIALGALVLRFESSRPVQL